MTSEDCEVTESVSEGGPSSRTFNPRRTKRRRQRRAVSRERPATATLAHPNILDESLKDKVDMTLTKKELLAAVKLCNERTMYGSPATRTSTNLARLRKLRQHSSNDETGSSSGSAEQIYLPPRGRRTRGRTAAGTRPATSKLERPSVSDMDIPNIRYYSKPRNIKPRVPQKINKNETQRKIFSKEDTIQEPCYSCGRTDQPERFHTHPGKTPLKTPLKETHTNHLTGNHGHNHQAGNHGHHHQAPGNSSDTQDEKKPRDRLIMRRAGPRSLSPKKSLSPDKSISSSDSSPQGSNKTDRHGKENSQEKSKRRKSLELHEKRSKDTFNRTHPPPQITEVVHEKKNSLENNKTSDGQNRKDSKEKKKIREITSPLKFHRPIRTHEDGEKKGGKDFTVDIFTVPDKEAKKCIEKTIEEDTVTTSEGEGKPEKNITVPMGRPTAVKCKICGKEFGKASIKFHEPQCERKRQGEEDRKEKEKIASLEMEKTVTYIDHLEDEGLNDSFDAIWEAHMAQLEPCSICGRTFFPERLIVHERSCKFQAKPPKTADPSMARTARPTNRLGGHSPSPPAHVPEQVVRDIPVQYFIAK